MSTDAELHPAGGLLSPVWNVCRAFARRGLSAAIPFFLGLLALGLVLAIVNWISPIAPFVYTLF